MNNAQSYYINEIVSGESGSSNIKDLENRVIELERKVEELTKIIGG